MGNEMLHTVVYDPINILYTASNYIRLALFAWLSSWHVWGSVTDYLFYALTNCKQDCMKYTISDIEISNYGENVHIATHC